MDRNGCSSALGTERDVQGGAGFLCSAIDAVVSVMTAMRPLRRECDRLMDRHVAGLAGPGDRHSYQMARVRLMMLDSVNRGVRHTGQAREVVEDRDRLRFRALLNDGDPFPEPLPS